MYSRKKKRRKKKKKIKRSKYWRSNQNSRSGVEHPIPKGFSTKRQVAEYKKKLKVFLRLPSWMRPGIVNSILQFSSWMSVFVYREKYDSIIDNMRQIVFIKNTKYVFSVPTATKRVKGIAPNGVHNPSTYAVNPIYKVGTASDFYFQTRTNRIKNPFDSTAVIKSRPILILYSPDANIKDIISSLRMCLSMEDIALLNTKENNRNMIFTMNPIFVFLPYSTNFTSTHYSHIIYVKFPDDIPRFKSKLLQRAKKKFLLSMRKSRRLEDVSLLNYRHDWSINLVVKTVMPKSLSAILSDMYYMYKGVTSKPVRYEVYRDSLKHFFLLSRKLLALHLRKQFLYISGDEAIKIGRLNVSAINAWIYNE
jgi:hypothetical protein